MSAAVTSPVKNNNEEAEEIVLIIQTSNLNSQPEQIEVAVRISKFLIKGFSIIKTYHSHSNSFHTVFTRTYGFYLF